jgi:hypothetical protein
VGRHKQRLNAFRRSTAAINSGEIMRSSYSAAWFSVARHGRLHKAVLLAAIGSLAAGAQAQATWPAYSVTAKLKPVAGLFGMAQPTEAKSLNSNGLVAGWTSKSAGTVWRIGTLDDAWSALGLGGSGAPYLYNVPMSDTYPVLWTGGVPKVLPRYNGSNSSWGYDLAANGAMLVTAAPIAGRIPRDYDQRKNSLYVLNGSTYTAVGAGPVSVTSRATPYAINNQGAVAGLSETRLQPFLWQNGQLQYISGPAGGNDAFLDLRGLSDTGTVLLHLNPRAVEPARCFTWSAGQLSELLPPSPEMRMDCKAINASGAVAGLLHRVDAQGKGSAAVFVARNGQFTVQAFQPYQIEALQGNIKLNAAGTVAYQSGYTVQADGTVRSSIMLFANGQTQSLDSLVTPALPAGQFLELNDFNDKGQVLARLRTGTAVTQPQWVLSPK